MAKDGNDLQAQRDANRDAALRAEQTEDRDFTQKERETLATSLSDKDASSPGVPVEKTGYSIGLAVIEKDKDADDNVSHTFLVFTDPDGNKTILGFYPKGKSLPEKVLGEGEIRNDESKLAALEAGERDGTMHTVAVSEEQYEKAKQDFESLHGTTYFLGGKPKVMEGDNCSTAACRLFTEATGESAYKGRSNFYPDTVLETMRTVLGRTEDVVGFGKYDSRESKTTGSESSVMSGTEKENNNTDKGRD